MMSIALRARPPIVSGIGTPAADMDSARANTEEWAQLWFTLERHGWGSLALVPAAADTSSRRLADGLVDAARAYHTSPVEVIDAEYVAPEDVQAVIAAVRARSGVGARVLIALASPLVRAPAIPLARAADAALLVVPLENSAAGDARRTIAAIGAPHFLGSVTVRPR